jgi:hypothetical protein
LVAEYPTRRKRTSLTRVVSVRHGVVDACLGRRLGQRRCRGGSHIARLPRRRCHGERDDYPFGCRLLGRRATGAEAERAMRTLIILAVLVPGGCESRHTKAPTPASQTSNVAPPGATSNTTTQAGAMSHPRSQITLAEDAPVEENTDYTVASTGLRVRLHDATRSNLPQGHAWRGGLSVCDGADCTELHLGGPDVQPVTWHGYRFELTFVIPTSLRITRVQGNHGATTP